MMANMQANGNLMFFVTSACNPGWMSYLCLIHSGTGGLLSL